MILPVVRRGRAPLAGYARVARPFLDVRVVPTVEDLLVAEPGRLGMLRVERLPPDDRRDAHVVELLDAAARERAGLSLGWQPPPPGGYPCPTGSTATTSRASWPPMDAAKSFTAASTCCGCRGTRRRDPDGHVASGDGRRHGGEHEQGGQGDEGEGAGTDGTDSLDRGRAARCIGKALTIAHPGPEGPGCHFGRVDPSHRIVSDQRMRPRNRDLSAIHS